MDCGIQFKETEKKIRCLCAEHKSDRIFLLTDSGVAPLIKSFLPDVPKLVVMAGEESKTLAGAEKVWRFLTEEGALRRSVLVNVGGGMISDLGGFAAATFKRGIGFINVPTTLLAAVDASIGGKTGINFAGLKNEVGVFAMPMGVFPLTCLFDSLTSEEWLSGVGEALKTGLLDSPELFDLAASEEFVTERKAHIVGEVVRRCAEFKERVVAEDFRESGKRRLLNLGHTAGHAIEAWKLAHGTPIPHGIAVAHGLKMALERSRRLAGLPEKVLTNYEKVLERYFPPLQMTESQWNEAALLMAHDKKNTTVGEPAWVLLKDIGQPII